jgi:hypothetical protein
MKIETGLKAIRYVDLWPEDGAIAVEGFAIGGAGIGVRIGTAVGGIDAFLGNVLGQERGDRARKCRRAVAGTESDFIDVEAVGVVRPPSFGADAGALLQRLAGCAVAGRSLMRNSIVDPDYFLDGIIIGGKGHDRLTDRPHAAGGTGRQLPDDRRGQ